MEDVRALLHPDAEHGTGLDEVGEGANGRPPASLARQVVGGREGELVLVDRAEEFENRDGVRRVRQPRVGECDHLEPPRLSPLYVLPIVVFEVRVEGCRQHGGPPVLDQVGELARLLLAAASLPHRGRNLGIGRAGGKGRVGSRKQGPVRVESCRRGRGHREFAEASRVFGDARTDDQAEPPPHQGAEILGGDVFHGA
jgi:hypothetical protein